MHWTQYGLEIDTDGITTVELRRGDEMILAQALIVDGVCVYRPVTVGTPVRDGMLLRAEVTTGDAVYLDETVTRVRELSHAEFMDKVNLRLLSDKSAYHE